jgi:hypothetical protein
VLHGLRHVLTPGTPGYAALKLAAVGGVVGLQFALRRRDARHEPPAPEPVHQPSPRPHSRSKKKKRSRRRS